MTRKVLLNEIYYAASPPDQTIA